MLLAYPIAVPSHPCSSVPAGSVAFRRNNPSQRRLCDKAGSLGSAISRTRQIRCIFTFKFIEQIIIQTVICQNGTKHFCCDIDFPAALKYLDGLMPWLLGNDFLYSALIIVVCARDLLHLFRFGSSSSSHLHNRRPICILFASPAAFWMRLVESLALPFQDGVSSCRSVDKPPMPPDDNIHHRYTGGVGHHSFSLFRLPGQGRPESSCAGSMTL